MTTERKTAELEAAAANLPEPPPEEYPRAFGNYVLLAPLARGGMGEVFLAKSGAVAGLEKHCVLKTLRPHLTDDREYTSRFIDEARIVVKLGHRNICQVFDVGTVGERYYLAMEYIPGIDLRSVTHKVSEMSGVINPGMALHITCEVLEALDYAHRHIDPVTGTPLLLVHRDVSPQNVMVSWEGEAKLIDFGLAASTMKMEQTSPNVVMGKLAYMSPEQVRGERVDGRTDLFAAGVMLYELLSGERFYEGRSPYEIWGLAAQGSYRPRNWQALSAEMQAILDKALAANASARFPSCNEFREALEAYRFANGLRGDAPMLRQLMHQVFEKEIDESRKRLATLSQAKLREGPSGNFGHMQEPTLSIARAASNPTRPPSSRPHVHEVAEGTEPTQQHIKAAFGPQKTISLAAAALIAIALAGAGVTFVKASSSAVAPSLAPATALPTPPEIAQPTPPPEIAPPPPPPEIAPPALDAPPIDAPASVKEPPAPSPDTTAEPSKPVVATQKKKKAAPRVEEKPVENVDEKPAQEEPPPVVEKPVETKPAWTSLLWQERVDELKKRCPSLKCVSAVAKHRETFGALTNEELIKWRADLKACWQQCGLPFK